MKKDMPWIEKLLGSVIILQHFISWGGRADDAECDDHEDVGDDNDDSDTNDIDENNGHGTDQVRAENPVDDSRDKLRRRITQILWDTDNS